MIFYSQISNSHINMGMLHTKICLKHDNAEHNFHFSYKKKLIREVINHA